MYSVGIDIGYSSIKATIINGEQEIKYNKYLMHKGRVKETLINIIEEVLANYHEQDIKYGTVTGRGSKFLSQTGEVVFVNEVAAIVGYD